MRHREADHFVRMWTMDIETASSNQSFTELFLPDYLGSMRRTSPPSAGSWSAGLRIHRASATRCSTPPPRPRSSRSLEAAKLKTNLPVCRMLCLIRVRQPLQRDYEWGWQGRGGQREQRGGLRAAWRRSPRNARSYWDCLELWENTHKQSNTNAQMANIRSDSM